LPRPVRPEGCVGVGSAVALGAEAVKEDPLVVPLREGLIRPDKFIGNEDEGEGVLAGGLEDLLAEPPVLGDVDLVVPDVEGVEEELEAAAVVLHLPNRPDVSDVDGQGRAILLLVVLHVTCAARGAAAGTGEGGRKKIDFILMSSMVVNDGHIEEIANFKLELME